MLSLHWLSQLWSSRRTDAGCRSRHERIKERRLKLMRLEQRRVLNADFSFTPQTLTLSKIDGDLSVREASSGLTSYIEFDLAGSIWHDDGSTGPFAIDNSTPGHSILRIEKSDLENLSGGISLSAATSSFDLLFDVQSSPLDLSQMQGTLVVEGFGAVTQTTASDHQVKVADVSLSADHIELSRFHGDDITLNSSEIDFLGGADSFSGSTLTVLSTAAHVELGGNSDSATALDFTDQDISALDASFYAIRFDAMTNGGLSSLAVDESNADFSDALRPETSNSAADLSQLQLRADAINIDGSLTIAGGTIDLAATQSVTISDSGSLINHGGHVQVDAGESGTLLNAGNIDVSDQDGVGGTVHLLGHQVGLFGDATVDASGGEGGGEVLIGGDLHGDNDAIPHADRVFIGHDVEVHADALHDGDGGTVVVWSDEVTQVYGSLTARGGALLGDGGLIETSSQQQLIVTRGGDASATNGKGGTWLLDPLNVRIVDTSTVYQVTEFAQPPIFNPTISGSEVTDDAIEAELETGTTVVISTFNPGESEAGDITLEVSIDVTFVNSGDSAAFILSAANDIFINAEITASNGSLNVLLEANQGSDDLDTAAGNVNVNANIDTNGGLFSSTGVDFNSTTATITATGGVSITHTGLVDLGAISTGTEFGGTTFINGGTIHGNIDVGEGDLFVDGGNEDLLVLADITTTETMFLLADRNVIIEATVTAGGPGTPLNPSADLSITADADSDGVGGFWLRETGNAADARLNAGGNISIVGAELIDAVGNPGGNVSLRIDAGDAVGDQQIVADQDLTIVANFGSISTAGDIIVDGDMEATGGALTAFFTGTTFLKGTQTAGTDLQLQNAVQLTDDVTLNAGGDVILGTTVNDDGSAGTSSILTVNAGRDVLLVGSVGGLVAPGLDALTVTADGLIDFLNSVTVNGDIQVTATSTTDRVTFQDAVTTTNGGSVTITNAGLLVTSSAAQFNVAGDFLQNGTGTTELGAGITTTDGDITFEQAVVLTDAITVDTSSNDHDITFGSTIDSEITGANEEQTISFVNADGGDFTISWDSPVPPGTGATETTAPIPFGATAEEVQAALVDLDSLTEADILVVGDPGGPYTLVFRGAFRGTDVAEVTVDGSGLTGAGAAASVLTTLPGEPVVAEHNPLTLIAGAGTIRFQGDIGNGFVDLALGVDGDQTLGNLTIDSADQVLFDGVTTVATAGTIDFGADSVITNGILITGTDPITFQSGQSIRINGNVTSDVDLTLRADGDITLTDDGSLFTTPNDSNITIVADADGNSVGDLVMNAATRIDAGSGFIDVSAAEVFLGQLSSTSTNPTDADNPAIRVVATFRSITDINGDDTNLIANQRIDAEDPGAGAVLQAVLGIGSNGSGDDALETDLASLSAYNHDLSEQQVITLTNATGGTFTLTWDPPGIAPENTTTPIPFNATADEVKAAFLETFDTLSEADFNVSGQPGGPFILTFQGALRATDVPQVTADDVDLVGVGASVTAATIVDFTPAENNIRILDVGTTAGRVDLIFVHNEANQIEPQFAMATEDFGTGGVTELLFSAATPGQANNDIVIEFTVDAETHVGATAGVPIITVSGQTITIDLHASEDLDANGKLDPGEDLNGNGILDKGTTANALRDAINANHQANALIRALITTDYQTGFNDISANADGVSVALDGAGEEDGVIDINIESGDLRVVTDLSRPVYLEMRDGIDTFDPTDLAVAAIQSENTIKLTANTIEVFDDILAIQPLTQITGAIDDSTTTITVVDPRAFPDDGSEFFIQINDEILKVTAIDGNDLTVERGQGGTTAVAHVADTVIANINVDNGIRQYIDIQARVNFVLGADRVISTDDHYIGSLALREDVNGNGVLDAAEPFSDANSNGVFDAGEAFIDSNGNNIHDATEPFYDANGNSTFDGAESYTDLNLNGRYDTLEDFNADGVLQFNVGEDANRNGVLDPGEDLNGDGLLQLRGTKPATTADDDFFSRAGHDTIHITADSDVTGDPEGRVLLGTNSTISTDNGIEQQIAPRPYKDTGTDAQHFAYSSNSAFFSGEIVVSNLQSRFLTNPEQIADGRFLPKASTVYLGTLTFTIGVPGEKNLILDIDWGDHDRTAISPVPPVLTNVLPPKFVKGIYVFDATVDQHATRFLIPEGGATYSIPHDFPDAALNLKDFLTGVNIQEPGRVKPTDPFQVRFAVSQHSSIVIDGQSVLDPSVAPEDVASIAPADVPLNAPYDPDVNKPYRPDDPSITPTGADPLFQLSSTNVFDNPDAFLPRFDNGVVQFVIPTNRATGFIPKPDPVNAPFDLPRAVFLPAVIVSPSQLTTETGRSSAVSSSVTTDEFFELRRIDEGGSTESTERLTGTYDGELLLSNRELFEKFIRERGDGDYEIWFITKDNREGALVERPVIQFRLESGALSPPANDSSNLLQPLRLIPVPVPPPMNDAGDGADDDTSNDPPDGQASSQPPLDDARSAAEKLDVSSSGWHALIIEKGVAVDRSTPRPSAAQGQSPPDDSFSETPTDGSSEEQPDADSSATSNTSTVAPASLATGVLMFVSAGWRKSRFRPSGSSQFSRSARLARKRSASVDDQ